MLPDSSPHRRGLLGLILCGLLLDVTIGTSRTEAQRLYWTVREVNEIRRTCLDGSNTHVLDIPQISSPTAIAVDSPGGKIYWHGEGIFRANLDGTQPEAIIDTTAEAIAIDSAANKVYWVYPGPGGGVWRANSDGSGIEELVSGLDYPRGIALDVTGGKVYWTFGLHQNGLFGWIQRSDLDGSNVETIRSFVYHAFAESIVLDTQAGHLYWTRLRGTGIWRANLDGSDSAGFVLAGRNFALRHLALDPGAGKLYYTRKEAPSLYWTLVRADLDGSNETTLLTASDELFASAMALDLDPCGGPDCNGNGNPDDCDLCYGSGVDCNANGVPDECDDTTADCNHNGVWDPCEPDCNRNDYPDECDISEGVSQDCTGDGTPDECDPDCNSNGIADSCDIGTGTSNDCDDNGIPDECLEWVTDCNSNSIPDSCDLAAGTLHDVNEDGILDECPAPGSGLEFSWVPVDASAPFTTTQPDRAGEHTVIVLAAGTSPQIVEFEFRINGFGESPGSPTIGTAQAGLDASGLLGINANPSQPGLDLTLLNNQPWRENPGGNGIFDGAFIVTDTCHDFALADTRIPCGSFPETINWPACPGGAPLCLMGTDDFAFLGNLAVASVSTTFGYLSWGGASHAGACTVDDGVSSYYLGTLVLNVPADFVGTYTFGFVRLPALTFLNDCAGTALPFPTTTPGHVTLQEGACCTTVPGGGTAGCTSNVYQEDCQGFAEIFVAGKACDDPGFECPACAIDAHCADGVFCNGLETCDVPTDQCLPGSDPCTDLETCDEQSDTCHAKGACCDRSNEACTDFQSILACQTPLEFHEGVFLCTDLPDSDGDGVLDCLDQCPGVDDAIFTPECEAAIPTVSGWGIVVLTLLLLVAGKVYFRGRRRLYYRTD